MLKDIIKKHFLILKYSINIFVIALTLFLSMALSSIGNNHTINKIRQEQNLKTLSSYFLKKEYRKTIEILDDYKQNKPILPKDYSIERKEIAYLIFHQYDQAFIFNIRIEGANEKYIFFSLKDNLYKIQSADPKFEIYINSIGDTYQYLLIFSIFAFSIVFLFLLSVPWLTIGKIEKHMKKGSVSLKEFIKTSKIYVLSEAISLWGLIFCLQFLFFSAAFLYVFYFYDYQDHIVIFPYLSLIGFFLGMVLMTSILTILMAHKVVKNSFFDLAKENLSSIQGQEDIYDSENLDLVAYEMMHRINLLEEQGTNDYKNILVYNGIKLAKHNDTIYSDHNHRISENLRKLIQIGYLIFDSVNISLTPQGRQQLELPKAFFLSKIPYNFEILFIKAFECLKNEKYFECVNICSTDILEGFLKWCINHLYKEYDDLLNALKSHIKRKPHNLENATLGELEVIIFEKIRNEKIKSKTEIREVGNILSTCKITRNSFSHQKSDYDSDSNEELPQKVYEFFNLTKVFVSKFHSYFIR